MTSCTATPELSKTVRRWSPSPRCSSARSSSSPTSRTPLSRTRPRAPASRSSPRSKVCALLSQTRRSAEATSSGSSSCQGSTQTVACSCDRSLSREMCTPPALPANHDLQSRGSRAVVAVWISWHSAATSRAEAGTASQPSARISSQKRARRAPSRACANTRRQGVTTLSSRSCHRACTPQPSTPTARSARPRGASRLAARAAAAAVRSSVRRPSSKKMASRRAVRWLNSRLSPVFTGRLRASFARTPPGDTLMT
ncbi:unnamed protein product [Prorocentrum cordatum]|uniref:Uncharacterized protein n=2 Tax=Prorocentrum cordatum TaxID=2364126 RepID=A0ABN9UF58_9DINO|nr:unnamed protein product [Polarella glacialis]